MSVGLCAVDFDAWDEVSAKRELEELGLNTVLWNGTSDVVSSLDVYYERLFLVQSYAMSHKRAKTLDALAGALMGSPFERRESAAWKNAEDRLGPGGADFVFAELCPPRLGLPGVSRGGGIAPKYGCDARSALRGTRFEGYLKLEHAPCTVQANPHFNRNIFVATDFLCELSLEVKNEDMMFNDDEASAISTGARACARALVSWRSPYPPPPAAAAAAAAQLSQLGIKSPEGAVLVLAVQTTHVFRVTALMKAFNAVELREWAPGAHSDRFCQVPGLKIAQKDVRLCDVLQYDELPAGIVGDLGEAADLCKRMSEGLRLLRDLVPERSALSESDDFIWLLATFDVAPLDNAAKKKVAVPGDIKRLPVITAGYKAVRAVTERIASVLAACPTTFRAVRALLATGGPRLAALMSPISASGSGTSFAGEARLLCDACPLVGGSGASGAATAAVGEEGASDLGHLTRVVLNCWRVSQLDVVSAPAGFVWELGLCMEQYYT